MKVRLSSFLKKIPSCLIHNVIFTSVRGRDGRGGNGEVVGNRKRPSSLPLQLVKPWNLDGDSRFVFPRGRKCWPLITIMKGVMGRSRDREKNTLAPYWSNLSPALDIRSPNPFRKMSRSTFIVHQPLPYSSVPLVNERKKKKQILLANVCNHTLTLITLPTIVPGYINVVITIICDKWNKPKRDKFERAAKNLRNLFFEKEKVDQSFFSIFKQTSL